MYFLVEGEVEIVADGRVVAVLGPGSWFGEMGKHLTIRPWPCGCMGLF